MYGSFGRGFGYGMGGFSAIILFSTIIPVVIIILLVIARGRSRSSLVLKEFFFNENEDEFLIIRGRVAGFFGWLFSLLNIASITSFVCNKQFLKYEASGIRYNIPLARISCVAFGKSKPVGLLILGIVFILGGIVGVSILRSPSLIFLGLLTGIILIIIYSKINYMQFSIYVGENRPLVTIQTKTGVVGGQTIDTNSFELAANALNKAVLAKS